MAQFGNNDKLLVWTFPRSLTGACLAFLPSLRHQRSRWVDLARFFVEQYKLKTEIAPDREQLQRKSKKSSESFQEYAQRCRQDASQV